MKFQTSSLRQNSFQDMNLSPVLFAALEKMSIKKPTPIQSQAIPVVMNGSDLIGIAQTGSGKTLAYALSVLTGLANKPNSRALILAPSREMAQQIYKVFLDLCKEMPISVCLAIGGTTGSKQANQLKKNPKIIIATPGRMNDHLQTNKLLLKDVEYVVIDEADRMLDMGFAPQLKNIQLTLRGNRQTLMFSASFGHNVDMIAQLFLHPKAVMIRSEQAEAPVESLKQKVLFLDRAMKNDRLLDELNATRGGVIVFTGSQESCENVGEYLKSYGFDTDLIHGGLSQGQRNRVVRAFREGEIRIMVATDLLARGLDVPHVDHVVNFDLPFQAEDFLHRIGRTARAGRNGEAITFVTPSDHRMYNKVKGYLQGAKEEQLDPSFKFIDRSKKFAKKSDARPVSKRSAGKGAPPPKKGSGKSSVNPFKKRR
ncbi:ATP-dependent helicase [Bdellovibrio sp. ZAP7]|uniref:DEAD/DEAH box helicase n=1 Tax=Bdellovibrio sp. ZAP7 TaxID=2231053 RepID=UPI001158CE30|nr:DEAD/DEAH box helicase [Bdellovibrio sp. ZAP7]QDK43923.1 ATP-dependent helicase [Bdellovibrio sp. ZAP7]